MLLLPQLCQTADPWILAQAEQVPVVKVAVYILFVDRGNSGVPDAKPVQQGGQGAAAKAETVAGLQPIPRQEKLCFCHSTFSRIGGHMRR